MKNKLWKLVAGTVLALAMLFGSIMKRLFLLVALSILFPVLAAAQSTIRAEALNDQAVELIDAGKFAQAVKPLKAAIQLQPDYTIAYGNLGAAFYGMKQFPDATVALEKTIELKSTFAEDYSKLGAIYDQIGRTDEAIILFKRAVVLQPDFASAHYNLGNVYLKLQKFREAVVLLERAVALEPNNATMRLELGNALSRRKKFREAIAQIEQAVKIQPQDPKAQLFLGQLYLAVNNKQSAQTQYQKILPLNSALAQKLYQAIYSDKIIDVSNR